MACGVFLFGLFFIVLSSPFSASKKGVKAQDPWLSQPQSSVSVAKGEVLHLECEVSKNRIPGGVKWFLGEKPQRKLIYADVEIDENDERITRNSPRSDTDFSISIHNFSLEDAGTYYCVKEKKGAHGTTDWLKGRGTEVVVKASRDNSSVIPIAAGVSGVFILVCLFCVALYVYLKMKKEERNWACLCYRSKDEQFEGLRNNHTRSDFPKKQQTSKPISGDKEIVYADLKDPSELQLPKKINSEERSEYATIKGAPSRAADKETFHNLNL
ncbi:tyrosine-protein phosphatase non-receptor type substrate 1-like [Pantherophis guttatus]|uniref:Tyrosine-protein phosphatase non-receptor type substrate 1-like n=1 Tax=Pantherophis guttatus TaxID=94885 RepID=A0ABM3YWN9_PANGU|nr:tyrosine-protein phosphatase non-receptor type substrate 1-like [Pantherophis guttatus]